MMRNQLLLMIVLAAACAGKGKQLPTTPRAIMPTASSARPAWLTQYPSACALGESGPTLVPTDAIAEARRKARALIATKNTDSKTKSVTTVDNPGQETRVRQAVLDQTSGWANNTEIVTLWYDAHGTGPSAIRGSVYAVACPLSGITTEATAWAHEWRGRRGGPDWIYSVTQEPRGLCVVAICGPTLIPSDALSNTTELARGELAEAIALHASATSAVLENDETLYAVVTNQCESCEEKAKAGKIVSQWLDKSGIGPLPFPGTAYALMCLDSQ